MNQTPSLPALRLLKQQGLAPTRTLTAARTEAESFLARAKTSASLANLPGAEDMAVLRAADDVTALCAAAVYAGLGLGTLPSSACTSSDAIDLLEAELGLSVLTTAPLRQLREHLTQHSSPAPTFLVYQCSLLCLSLVDWTAEFCCGSLCLTRLPVPPYR